MYARASRYALTLLAFVAGLIALVLPAAALAQPDGAQAALTAS